MNEPSNNNLLINYLSEKYTKGVSAVESILTLDRLRQSVAVKELLQAQGQPLMRKTASVPNFSQMLSRFDSSSLSDFQVCRSESVNELCNAANSGEETSSSKQYGIGRDFRNFTTFFSYISFAVFFFCQMVSRFCTFIFFIYISYTFTL